MRHSRQAGAVSGSDSHLHWMPWAVVIALSLIAAGIDVQTRRIPNWLTLPAVAAGLVVSGILGGWAGIGSALAGCIVVALPFVLLWSFGGGGAGDAKLMGAIGAWLGLGQGVIALVAVLLSGAVLGIGFAALKHRLVPVLANVRRMSTSLVMPIALRGAGIETGATVVAPETATLAMPYGIAIFTGVCIAAAMGVLL